MLRAATDEDWLAMTGQNAPAYWIGYAYEEGGVLLGVGGIYEGQDGRWWASVKARARRPMALFRAARRLLDVAARADVPVHAMADDTIHGACHFLTRLGFRGTGEVHSGYEVLRWTP